MKTYYPVKPGLAGPYNLNATNVALFPDGPGVYVLSDKANSGAYLARYVGRAASLRARLGQHVGKYLYVYYKETETVNGAFFTECRLYHAYGKSHHLDNAIHPAIPAGSRLPKCSETGCSGEAY